MFFFPNLYKDELLFSVLARYYQYSGAENKKDVMNDLFDSSTTCATTILPTQLQKLSENLPIANAYSADYFINNHTFLPYSSPFITKERNEKLRKIMKNENGTTIYMNFGRPASSIKNEKKLKYCLSCIDEEIQINGECYWHRTHQIEGVKVCPIHHKWLIESSVPFTNRKHKHEFVSLEKSICDSNLLNKNTDIVNDIKHLLYIAEQTYYLLNNHIEPLGLDNLKKYYISILNKRGLVTVKGRIRWLDIIPIFNQYYGAKLLEELNCYVNPNKMDTWLHKLLRNPKVSCHPLRHILLLGFLGETIPSMVHNLGKYSNKPFGNGPWLCLNKAAEHYNDSVITSCVITRDSKTGLPVGTFSCDCGFVYSRKGPDKTVDDKHKIGRIKKFGHVWENKLARLSQKELSLRKMAEILGVDPMTVKNKLNLKVKAQTKILSSNKMDTRQKYRAEWEKLLESNIDKSITELRKLNQKVYTWLYRNDKEWLKSNYSILSKVNSKIMTSKVDWAKRDQEMVRQAELTVESILSEKNKLVRVTKNEIGRRLGKLASLSKSLNKLPKTKEFLDRHIESVEQFQIRRIKHVVKELKKTNSSLKEWEVIRVAGLKKEFAEKLKDIIISEINKV